MSLVSNPIADEVAQLAPQCNDPFRPLGVSPVSRFLFWVGGWSQLHEPHMGPGPLFYYPVLPYFIEVLTFTRCHFSILQLLAFFNAFVNKSFWFEHLKSGLVS